MSDDKPVFNLNDHIVRLLMDEPFFASLSRRIDKIATTSIPTAGVRVNPDRAQFEMFYNPEFMAALKPEHRKGVLMHEFYHIIFEHVTGRRPADGIRKIDNIAMDLSINCHIRNFLPREADPGPVLTEGGEPMKACLPGEGHDMFRDLPDGQTYEWYLAKLEQKAEEEKQNGNGDPFGDVGDFDDHDAFGSEGQEADGTANEIAKERLKQAMKKAAEDASKSNNWGSVSQQMRKEIMERISTQIDWRKVLRYFIKTSQRSDRRSTPRKINRRFPRIHPGKRVTRQAKIAISIDQSGSVDDGMLNAFFSELNALSDLATFTVIPFDTTVGQEHVYVWKKGQKRDWTRVMYGGTCFDAPTRYVNERDFDGHIVLTDLCAPKPIASRCQRMWMTTKEYAERPYFSTNERIVAIDRK